MKALKFEIFGLLKQTRIDHIRTSVPTYPELSSELQMEILKIPEIIGCGTAYGQIVMHMSRTTHPDGPSGELEDKIKHLLQKHNCSNGYNIDLIGEIKELSFKQGNKIQNPITFGTLGCFVQETNTKELFGIACAHCVMGDQRQIEIHNERGQTIFGNCSHYVYWKDYVDIAAIEIDKNDYKDCSTSIELENCMKCEKWTFQKGYPDTSLIVYKRGCKTGLTQGRIFALKYFDKKSTTIEDSKRVGSILIENCETTSAKQQHCSGAFSAQGDSGSVVWYENLGLSDEPVATVIGIVFKGAHNENGTFEFTYCCPIERSIQELEKILKNKFGPNCQIKPAR